MTGPGGADPTVAPAELGVQDVRACEPVTGGTSAAVWRVETGAGTRALRVLPPGREQALAREVGAMRAARASGAPVPAVLAVRLALERPAVLLEWLPGRPLLEELGERPERAGTLLRAFGRTQGRIHRASPPADAEAAPDSWIHWAGAQDDALTARLRAEAAPEPKLIHLDYHPLNVLVEDGRVTGVLDWENARAGDPRADLARTVSMLLLEGPADLSQDLRHSLIAGWSAGCEEEAGPLHMLPIFLAWAGEAMLRDLGPKRPELARVREWTGEQRRLAGLP
jgi:Ser/Thr protein kinase RdoA (MazF antagonist)